MPKPPQRRHLSLAAVIAAAIACADSDGPTSVPVPPIAVSVTLPQPGLSIGSSIQAYDTLKDANGNVLTGRKVTWSSSNASVARISQTGVVTGMGRGTAQISATSDGVTGVETISVVAIKPRSLSAGGTHTCAIATNGDLYCWGSNYNGEIGFDSTQNVRYPTRVSGALKFTAVSTTNHATYALTEDGRLYCWGAIPCDPNARISRWDEFMGPSVNTPRRVPTSRALEILGSAAATDKYQPVCAIGVGNVGYCWGSNRNGEIGIGGGVQDTVLVPDPPVVGNYSFADISAGSGLPVRHTFDLGGHACAITTAGVGYCWGHGRWGALGDGSGTESFVPRRVAGTHVFKSIAAGSDFSCGVTVGGEAYCWGRNNEGQLGTATDTCLGQPLHCSATPVAVSIGVVFESVSGGRFFACGLASTGDVYCWGQGYGHTGSLFRSVRAHEPGGQRFLTVSVGGSHACATSANGDIYCRGSNNLGQLGNGGFGGTTDATLVAGGIKFRTP